MKRTCENTSGPKQFFFQAVPQKPRVDISSHSSTLPPGRGSGQPVMKSITPRESVRNVWQNSGSSAIVPLQANHSNSAQAGITVKADKLRAAILSANDDVIYDLLNDPDASEIAMMTDAQGKNALFYAIEKNDLLTADSLLSLPNSERLSTQQSNDGLLPLDVAAAKGSLVVVHLLLDLDSAREQLSASLSESKNLSGHSALMGAVTKGHDNVLKALLGSSHAAALELKRSPLNFNALMIGVATGNVVVVQALLESPHASSLVLDTKPLGSNALMFAAGYGHVQMVNALLGFGLIEQQLAATTAGGNALDYAIRHSHHSIAMVLRQHGAVETRETRGNPTGQSVPSITPRQ